MKMLVTHTTYRFPSGELVVPITGRCDDGRRRTIHLINTKPYFYVEEETPNAETSFSIFGKKVFKIVCRSPQDVPKLREHYHHYEADIPYTDRIRIDLGIKQYIDIPDNRFRIAPEEIVPCTGNIKPVWCVIDLETDKKRNITAFGVYDSELNKYFNVTMTSEQVNIDQVTEIIFQQSGIKPVIKVQTVSTKEDILNWIETYKRTRNIDIISGWNVGTGQRNSRAGFDLKVINENAGHEVFDQQSVLDAMAIYEILYEGEIPSRKLEWCAQDCLGYTKLDIGGMYENERKSNIDSFVAYNITDCLLVKEMIEKRDMINWALSIAELGGVDISSVITEPKMSKKHKRIGTMKIVEQVMHFMSHGKAVIPSRKNNKKQKGGGGYVHKPSTGIFKWVAFFDFKSEYIELTRTFDISPDAKVGPDYTGPCFTLANGVRFRKEPRGLLPRLFDEQSQAKYDIQKLRDACPYGSDEYKMYDRKRDAVKFLLLSVVGLEKNVYFKLYDPDSFNAVTSTGRAHAEFSIKQLTDREYMVLYGDTDSSLPQMKGETFEEVMKEGKELEGILNKSYDEFALKYGAEKHSLSTKFEKLAEVFFQAAREEDGETVGKKQYAALLAWIDGKDVRSLPIERRMVIKGFKMVRSDSPEFTAEMQQELFKKILTEGKESAIKYCDERMKFLKSKKFDYRTIGIPSTIKKSLEEYKVNSEHVSAARWSNKNLGKNFGEGSKIKFYMMNDGQVFALERNEEVGAIMRSKIDLEWHIDRCLKKPTQHILAALEKKDHWNKPKERDLFSF